MMMMMMIIIRHSQKFCPTLNWGAKPKSLAVTAPLLQRELPLHYHIITNCSIVAF